MVKAIDKENGVICIQHKNQGDDLSGDLALGVSKIHAIFHIDDVFNTSGEKFRANPDTNALTLVGAFVDLTARCLINESLSVASLYHDAASQSLLAQTSASPVICPLLQAVCVYLKTSSTAAPVTLFSPRPTKLRTRPENVDINETSTSFYLSYLLPLHLDSKALNFFSVTNQAKLQREVNNGFAMAHFNSSKRNKNSDKMEQQKFLDDLDELDTFNARNLIYGKYEPISNNPLYNMNLPQVLNQVIVKIQLLYQQGLDAKDGLVRFEVAVANGPRIIQYAFFDISCYKFSLKSENRQKDLANVIPVYDASLNLKANLVLANRSSQVPYVCTAIWNSNSWYKEPDAAQFPSGNISMDKLFMEKYDRIVSSIVSSHQQSTAAAMMAAAVLPSPIPASSSMTSSPVLRWADMELIR